jgi:hypothetical protein
MVVFRTAAHTPLRIVAMNNARRLQIANRIHLHLLRELNQGIEVGRFLAEPLYARDVLLVCDAMPGSDLASLAQHFRTASAERIEAPGRASDFGRDSSGFDHSRPAPEVDAETAAPPVGARHWYSPSRWLGL